MQTVAHACTRQSFAKPDVVTQTARCQLLVCTTGPQPAVTGGAVITMQRVPATLTTVVEDVPAHHRHIVRDEFIGNGAFGSIGSGVACTNDGVV